MQTKQSKRNLIVSITIIMIFLFLFTNCTKKKSNQIVLDFMNMEGSINQIRLMKQIVSRFEKENPDVRINLISAVKQEKILNTLVSGSGVDVFFDGSTEIQEYSSRGSLLSLNSHIEKNKFPVSDYYSFGMQMTTDPKTGKVMGLPLQIKTTCIAYNKDQLQRTGIGYPPTEWDTDMFERYLARLYAAPRSGLFSVSTVPFGMTILIKDLWDEQNGVINNTKRNDFLKVTEYFRGLFKYLPTSEEIQEAASGGVSGFSSLFSTQKTFLQIAPAWVLIDLLTIRDFEWDVVECPHNVTLQQPGEIGYLAIAASSKYPEEAFRFASFYVNEYSANRYAATKNGMSGRIASTENFFCKAPPENVSIYKDILKKYNIISSRPRVKGYEQFNTVVGSEIGADFRKGKILPETYTRKFFEFANQFISAF